MGCCCTHLTGEETEDEREGTTPRSQRLGWDSRLGLLTLLCAVYTLSLTAPHLLHEVVPRLPLPPTALGATAQVGLRSRRMQVGADPHGASLSPWPLPGHLAMRPMPLLGACEVLSHALAHLLLGQAYEQSMTVHTSPMRTRRHRDQASIIQLCRFPHVTQTTTMAAFTEHLLSAWPCAEAYACIPALLPDQPSYLEQMKPFSHL